VAQLYPRALGYLFVASYNSQAYGGGILTRLHIGNWICPAYNIRHKPQRKYHLSVAVPLFVRAFSRITLLLYPIVAVNCCVHLLAEPLASNGCCIFAYPQSVSSNGSILHNPIVKIQLQYFDIFKYLHPLPHTLVKALCTKMMATTDKSSTCKRTVSLYQDCVG
jgi:hypothetical protein